MTSRDRPEREGDVRFPLQATPEMLLCGAEELRLMPLGTPLDLMAERVFGVMLAASGYMDSADE